MEGFAILGDVVEEAVVCMMKNIVYSLVHSFIILFSSFIFESSDFSF